MLVLQITIRTRKYNICHIRIEFQRIFPEILDEKKLLFHGACVLHPFLSTTLLGLLYGVIARSTLSPYIRRLSGKRLEFTTSIHLGTEGDTDFRKKHPKRGDIEKKLHS